MSVDDWLDTVASIDGIHFMPLGVSTVVESTRLPGEFHKDPADRMIVSLARHFNATLITADGKIAAYKYVRTIW
ncbi:PIN domain-containing protein [Chromohalobacter canadensis]|uniref:PIN domain-containing protein n=1 Tax=Chromohalobacter canadensis TaxID=141389 RepID=UPI001C53719A|nr:PIN domain-containing protein [Chromohalobacter canadensis]